LDEEEIEMAPSHCPVCGCGELRIDEVSDRGSVLLTECPRCEFRRVERGAGLSRAALRVTLPSAEEIAAA
jgi:hypothetical protein